MCGRYALDHDARDLARQFALAEPPDLVSRYNISPTTPVLAILQSDGMRRASRMTWGLDPRWAETHDRAGTRPRPINARSETVSTQPMFRSAFRSRRCVLPASGFYEWQRPDHGPKQPFFFRHAAGEALAMAGLFEPGDVAGTATCCILTRSADDVVLPVHDRMPVLLHPAALDLWLDPAATTDALRTLLARPCPVSIAVWPVSARVNDTGQDDPGLIQPLTADNQP